MFTVMTNKGQVTVPKLIRDRLGIGPGTRLRFQAEADGSLRAWPVQHGSAGLFGLLHDADRATASVDEMNTAIAAQVVADDVRVGRKKRAPAKRP